MSLNVALKILDPRLKGWGFPHYGSELAAGLDLHACTDEPLVLQPQAPAVLISAGIALRIGDPQWCALVLPRSGLGHGAGLVLGNAVGVIDADYEGPLLISTWNRNPAGADETILINPATGSRSSSSPASRERNSRSSLSFPIAAAGRRAASALPVSLPLVQTGRRGDNPDS
jgi:dUTP pyrophosphatase